MKSEDEIIDEFLRAEDIHHRGSVDYQELVNRENATSSRIPSKKLVFLWPFIAAACLILTFLFQKQDFFSVNMETDLAHQSMLKVEEAVIIQDVTKFSTEFNDFFLMPEDSGVDLFVMLDSVIE